MKLTRLLLVFLALAGASFGQNVRLDVPFPSVSSTSPPFLQANLPPNSPVLAFCKSPANAVPCTNFSTTFTGSGAACPNGAQDTPNPGSLTSACQPTGDAQGNIGVWSPAGTYDYTVCLGYTCYGPYTVTLGGSGGGGGSGAPNQSISFNASTSVVLATTFTSANLVWECYDNTNPANTIYPANVTINPSTFSVTFTFAVPQSGYCVVNGSGGSGGGGGSGLPLGTTGQVPVVNLAGTLYLPQSKPVIDVRDFAGADWCSQVNAADTANVGVTATLSVPQQMSGMTACTTSIALSSGHNLQFGAGTYNLGTLDARGGILIGHAVNDVSVIGAGRGLTTINYTSFVVPVGSGGNGFPWGSPIGVGTVTQCTGTSDANNHIQIRGITISDLNTGSALGSTHNPSGVDGACVNDIVIENNEFTNIKGNGAITVTGKFGGGGGQTYYDQNNLFDGTSAGGWGEFTIDNSENWTNFYVLNNIASGYKCGIGGAGNFRGLVANNTIDMTLVTTGCYAIGLGTGDSLNGYETATNNLIFLNSGDVGGIDLAPGGIGGNYELSAIGNHIYDITGTGSIYGITLNGSGSSSDIAPTEVVRGNYASTTFPTSVTGILGNVEVSDNVFDGTNASDIFNCSGTPSIQSGSVVRVFNNRFSADGFVAHDCTHATFASRQFQEWGNTIGNGAINCCIGSGTGYIGTPDRVIWTPGTIAAGASSSTQTATMANAIIGDEVKILADTSATWLTPGILLTGYVSSANTVTFQIVNTTSLPVTINSGSSITTYVSVDRPPLNGTTPAFGPITASGGGSGGGGNPTLENCTPDQTGNSFYSATSLTNYFAAAWQFIFNTTTYINCTVYIPTAQAGATVAVDVWSSDATAGHTASITYADGVINSGTVNIGSLTSASNQTFTTTSTANNRVTLTFNVQSTLANGSILVVKIGTAPTGTAPTANLNIYAHFVL